MSHQSFVRVIVYESPDRVQSRSRKHLEPHLSPSQRWSLSPPSPLRGDSMRLKVRRCFRHRQARNQGLECGARKGFRVPTQPEWSNDRFVPLLTLSRCGCVGPLDYNGLCRCHCILRRRARIRLPSLSTRGIGRSVPACDRYERHAFVDHRKDRH